LALALRVGDLTGVVCCLLVGVIDRGFLVCFVRGKGDVRNQS